MWKHAKATYGVASKLLTPSTVDAIANYLRGKPVIAPEEREARNRGIDEWAKGNVPLIKEKYLWKGIDKEVRTAIADRLDKELRHPTRLWEDLPPHEQKELLEGLADVEAEKIHQRKQNAEGKARYYAMRDKLNEDPSHRHDSLPPGRMLDLALEILRDQLARTQPPTLFSELSRDERRQAINDAYAETLERLNAVTASVRERQKRHGGDLEVDESLLRRLMMEEVHRRLSPPAADGKKPPARMFRDVTQEERQSLMKAVEVEIITQLARANRALQEGIDLTGSPWNWWIWKNKRYYLEQILDTLGDDLARKKESLSGLALAEQVNRAGAFTDIALRHMRGLPTVQVVVAGVILPIGIAYELPVFVPSNALQGMNMILPMITGPLSFGVNYWLGAKLKPYVALKNAERKKAEARTQLDAELEKIAADATGLSDQRKDGANMAKDNDILLGPKISLAVRTPNDADAIETLAAGLQHAAQNYKQVKQVTEDSAYLYYLEVKDRFGYPDMEARVRERIRAIARERGQSPSQALADIELILHPKLSSAPPPRPVVSPELDRTLADHLREAGNQASDDKALEHVAHVAMIFGSPRFRRTEMSAITMSPFHVKTRERFASVSAYEKAKQMVIDQCQSRGFAPDEALKRLEKILRPRPEDLELGVGGATTP